MSIEEKLNAALGEDFINIIKEWPQLSSEDIKEIYEEGIDNIYAVYDNWEDLARANLECCENREYMQKHIIPYINMELYTKHIEEIERYNWYKLKSGKLIKVD